MSAGILGSVARPLPLILRVPSNPIVITSGNWPEAKLNGSVDYQFTCIPNLPCTDQVFVDVVTMMSGSDFNGGFWIGPTVNNVSVEFGFYDTGGGILAVAGGCTFAAFQPFTIKIKRSNNTFSISGLTVGNVSGGAFGTGDIFTAGDLTVGAYANGGGYVFPGVVGNVYEIAS